MAKNNTYQVKFEKGVAYTVEGGKRVPVHEMQASYPDECCKLDCCKGGLYLRDIDTGDTYVVWFEGGVLQNGTAAEFEAALANYA